MRAILTYHSIDASGSPISISKDAFASHVDWLASGRVRVTTIDDLLQLSDDVDAVALTFDDGFRNFAEHAYPLLAEHGLPSTVFAVTDHVGGTNAWGGSPDPGVPLLPLLSWDELARLQEAGVMLGAHTRRHRHLSALGDDELTDEIAGAAEIMRRNTGRRPRGFAYPYGSLSASAAAVVGGCYAWGCTTELRVLRGDVSRARVPRLDMYYFRNARRLERWGTARFTCYVQLRAQARRVRQRFVS